MKRAIAIWALTIAALFCLLVSVATSWSRTQESATTLQRLIFPTPPPRIEFLFVVTSTGDGDDVGPGASCDDGTGNCTLRAAIEVANNNAGNDTIQFNIPTSDPGFDSSTGRWTINLGTALPDLSSNVAINGPGEDKLTVQRSATAGQFGIFNVTAAVVTLSGITIRNGNYIGAGAGVLSNNGANLTINNCTLRDNVAASNATGGAIYHGNGGMVSVNNCKLIHNSAAGGGAIESVSGTGQLSISNSTIDGNTATFPMGGTGGGIYIGSGTAIITNSTINNNAAVFAGGGITVAGGSLVTDNSTLTGNQAPSGGGIWNGATLTVANSTISGNTASGATDGGGGVLSNAGPATIVGSIIAANSAPGVNPPDVGGVFISGGFNLIGRSDGSTGFNQATDHVGTILSPLDPKLAPLADNGGPTETLALQSGSIAINNGPANAPPRDERGFARNGPPDIGAFEFNGTIPVSLGNISTRGFVSTGDNVLIGGFIISGTVNKNVLLRAIGPSLSDPPINLTGTLQDPTLSLFNSSGAMIDSNDNWSQAPNAQFIPAELQPHHPPESALLTSLAPGAYTVIVRGANGGTGLGLVEVFDLDPTVPTKLSNISTRGLVQTGDGVMIGGFIIKGPDNDKVVVRAIGPSLANPPFNLSNVLQNPTLRLFDANGAVFASNDDWQSDHASDIIATGLQPSNPAESAIVTILPPGNYTAIVTGVNGTSGLALVEVYGLN